MFTLQTLPACDEPFDDEAGKVAGCFLHAGVHSQTQAVLLLGYLAVESGPDQRLVGDA